ncbi:MAG: hypothetical protein AB7U66_04505, partial [Hyphomicrobiaceae bacterium]
RPHPREAAAPLKSLCQKLLVEQQVADGGDGQSIARPAGVTEDYGPRSGALRPKRQGACEQQQPTAGTTQN